MSLNPAMPSPDACPISAGITSETARVPARLAVHLSGVVAGMHPGSWTRMGPRGPFQGLAGRCGSTCQHRSHHRTALRPTPWSRSQLCIPTMTRIPGAVAAAALATVLGRRRPSRHPSRSRQSHHAGGPSPAKNMRQSALGSLSG